MGTYPTTPSLVLSSGEDLQKHLNANKEKLIGKAILDKFGTDLPFLPKVSLKKKHTHDIQSGRQDLTSTRSSQSPKPSPFKSTQTNNLPPNSTKKTPLNSATQTTSLKSPSLYPNSKSLLAGNLFPISNIYSPASQSSNPHI